jgi:hypothetical protein
MVVEEQAVVHLVDQRMERRPEEGVGAAGGDQLAHHRLDLVGAVHEAAGGGDQAFGGAGLELGDLALELGHQGLDAPPLRGGVDEVEGTSLGVAVGEPFGQGGAGDHGSASKRREANRKVGRRRCRPPPRQSGA